MSSLEKKENKESPSTSIGNEITHLYARVNNKPKDPKQNSYKTDFPSLRANIWRSDEPSEKGSQETKKK